MFIGKWNKSVILTYIGLIISVFGIYICFNNSISVNLTIICLMLAGVCDMFDGFIARKCKRTEEEKKFGIELDSLVDAISFIALPISIFLKIEMNEWYNFIIFGLFAICGVARLAYFNITVENSDKPVKYYSGLPVTFSAIIFPLFYLLSYIMPIDVFKVIFTILNLIIAILNISNIKIIKPKGIAYAIFSFLAIAMIVIYVFIV